MEDIKNNKVLCLNNEDNIARKRLAILNILEKGGDVLCSFDTETTGLNVYPKAKDGVKRDRILEVGFVMYYFDKDNNIKPIMLDGMPVSFQEYVNPFRESPAQLLRSQSVSETNQEAFNIHKITNGFLDGKESFDGVRLHKPAPTFAEIKPFMEDFLCLDKFSEVDGTMHFLAHNGKAFDAPMLTEEMYLVDKFSVSSKKSFDSIVPSIIDTLEISRDLFNKEDLRSVRDESKKDLKEGYNMSYLAHLLNVPEIGRENFHGALLDSLILKNVFEAMINTEQWETSKNKIEFNKVNDLKKNRADNKSPLPILSENTSSKSETGDFDVLNVIKTDASYNEGTGTVKEYIEAGKAAGVSNLVMADVLTTSRFVEFYEGCKKADIKPIIGTTFKVESYNDIENHLYECKKIGLDKDLFSVFNRILIDHDRKGYTSVGEMIASNTKFKIENFIKTMSEIVNLNNKKYTTKPTPTKTMNDMSLKIIKNFLTMMDIKPISKLKSRVELINDVSKAVYNNKKLSSYKPFTRTNGHSNLLLVADNDNGFLTLKKLISDANKVGQHFLKKDVSLPKGEFPLLTLDMLKNSEDVTALIGHKNDILGRAVKAGDVRRSQRVIRDLKNIFGDRLKAQISFSEQNTDPTSENTFLKNVASVCSAQSVDSVAVHNSVVALKEDFDTHKNKYAILMEINSNNIKLDTGNTEEEYIRSKDFLISKFKNNNEVLKNSNTIIKKSQLAPVLHKPSLPKFKTTDGRSQSEELRFRTYKGFEIKVKSAFNNQVRKGLIGGSDKDFQELHDKYKERVDRELKVIEDMDFPGYFLIKQEMIGFCKEEGIPVGAGRGSAAGSMVVYSLGITEVDPIEHGLIFERFLNPERVEMPDIDTDIDGSDRIKVLNFIIDRYKDQGMNYSAAAYILTKGTFSPKSTIQAISKAEGMQARWVKELSGVISSKPETTLASELENNETLIERYESEIRTKKIIDKAIELEKNGGRQKSIGKHPGGLVIGPLITHAPIVIDRGIPMVQADKYDIESLGAVKFDLLGVETLAKISLTLDFIVENKGIEELEKIGIKKEGKSYNWIDYTYEDSEVFDMLSEGNTTNVFQVESSMFKDLIKLIKPKDLEELTAVISLGRPGPLQAKMDILFANNKENPEMREKYHE